MTMAAGWQYSGKVYWCTLNTILYSTLDFKECLTDNGGCEDPCVWQLQLCGQTVYLAILVSLTGEYFH